MKKFIKLFSFFKEYSKDALISPVLVTFEVILNTLIPYLMSLLIDRGILGYSQDMVIKLSLILFLATLLSFICGLLSTYFATRASSGLAKNLRYRMFEKIGEFTFKNIDSFKKGSLVTRMSTDVQFVQMASQVAVRLAIRAPLMLLFSFFMAFKLNDHVAIYFLIIIPIITIGMFFITTGAHPVFKKVFKTTDKLNTMVSENLSGIRVVKSYVKEGREKEKFNEISTDLFHNYRKASRLLALASPLMQFSTYLMSLLIARVGAGLIVKNLMTTGALTSLITYAIQIQISLMTLSMVLVQITIVRNAVDRIFEILETKPDILSPENPIRQVKNGSVEFKDVHFSYAGDENKCVLKDINFKISSGDYVGIIGPTGSGKSTLVNLIARFYDTDKGEVIVSGENVKNYELKILRDKVSVVLQKNQLFSGSLRENLKWAGEDLSDEKLIDALKRAKAYDFVMEKGGLDGEVEREGTNFSGGQKQRISIARSLLKDPKILILDDSTSALDNSTEKAIIDSLRTVNKDMTKIIISQRVNSLKDCDYIIVLNDGEIESVGSHEDLIKRSKIYGEIFVSQEGEGDFDEKE
ncbi:ABC transporter ATP-binding protein [Peptoniphilus raoultii]|uniref:ABC transporter ATP-binding protein n=1 Tax=Peptoniphilus raoultii TaxID=1776387 RepID=UPI0008DAF174|nr:ABC transporter ATP-binding protein [Peptoniphilus raoultii]